MALTARAGSWSAVALIRILWSASPFSTVKRDTSTPASPPFALSDLTRVLFTFTASRGAKGTSSLGANARVDEALGNAGREFVFANHAVQQITLLRNNVRHLWHFR